MICHFTNVYDILNLVYMLFLDERVSANVTISSVPLVSFITSLVLKNKTEYSD